MMIKESKINSFINLLRKSLSKHYQCNSNRQEMVPENLIGNFNYLKRRMRQEQLSHQQNHLQSIQSKYRQPKTIQNRSFRLKRIKYEAKQNKHDEIIFSQSLNLKKQLLRKIVDNEQKELSRCYCRYKNEQNRLTKQLDVLDVGIIQLPNKQTKVKQKPSLTSLLNKANIVDNRILIPFSQRQQSKLKNRNIHKLTRQNLQLPIKKCKSIQLKKFTLKPLIQIKKVNTEIAQTTQISIKQKKNYLKKQYQGTPQQNHKEIGVKKLNKSLSTKNTINQMQLVGWDYDKYQDSFEDFKNEE